MLTARRMISPARSADSICVAHLAIGVMAATRSISWKASRPAKDRLT